MITATKAQKIPSPGPAAATAPGTTSLFSRDAERHDNEILQDSSKVHNVALVTVSPVKVFILDDSSGYFVRKCSIHPQMLVFVLVRVLKSQVYGWETDVLSDHVDIAVLRLLWYTLSLLRFTLSKQQS